MQTTFGIRRIYASFDRTVSVLHTLHSTQSCGNVFELIVCSASFITLTVEIKCKFTGTHVRVLCFFFSFIEFLSSSSLDRRHFNVFYASRKIKYKRISASQLFEDSIQTFAPTSAADNIASRGCATNTAWSPETFGSITIARDSAALIERPGQSDTK